MTSVERQRISDVGVAAIAGDGAAFNALYEALAPSVFNLVFRSVHERAIAEDICQDVWVKAHREIHTLRSPDALTAWIYRMASRACIDYSRSKAFRDRSSVEIAPELPDSDFDNPEAALMRQSDLRSMWEALAALPPRQSLALYLKQVDECSYEEIGHILGCPKSAVETLLFRARHGLAAAHDRFQAHPEASCKMITTTMSVGLDREGTPIQQRAIQAHLAECSACRQELSEMRHGAAEYAWLPMLPAGGLSLDALLGGASSAGAGLGIGRVLAAMIVKGKAAGMAGLTAAAATGAAAGWTPGPSEAFHATGDLVAAVRDASFGGSMDMDDALYRLEAGAFDDRRDGSPGASAGGSPAAPLAAGSQAPSTAPDGIVSQGASATGPPPAGSLDDATLLNALPGLLKTLTNGSLGNFVPVLAYLENAIGRALGDPETLLQLLGKADELTGGLLEGTAETVGQTTEGAADLAGEAGELLAGQNGGLDDPAGAATEIVDGLTGGGLTDPAGTATEILDDAAGGSPGAGNGPGAGEVVDTTGEIIDDVVDVPADPVGVIEDLVDDPPVIPEILDDLGEEPLPEVLDPPEIIDPILDDEEGDGCLLIFC